MNINRGPCFVCLQPMNWFAGDSSCLPICRYCLGYFVEVMRTNPAYGLALSCRANTLAEQRGDTARLVVG